MTPGYIALTCGFTIWDTAESAGAAERRANGGSNSSTTAIVSEVNVIGTLQRAPVLVTYRVIR